MKYTALPPFIALLAISAAGCKATLTIEELTNTETSSEPSAGTSEPPITTGMGGLDTDNNKTTGTSVTPETTSTNDTGTGDPNTGTSAPDTTSTSTTNGESTTATVTSEGTSTTSGGGTEDLGDWGKYREVLIDNNLSQDFKDFQVSITVDYDSDMAPDYSDLRFTDETGKTILPYWLEWDTGPVNAFIWVRVPTIAADDITTIRMYYGNPNASPGSDGFDTFLFFDDFEAANLDAAKWKTTAPVTVNFGRLSVTAGSVYSIKPVADFPDTWAEARMVFKQEMGNGYPSGLITSQGQAPGPNIKYYNRQGGTAIVFDGKKFLAEKAVQSNNGENPLILGIASDDTDTYFSYNRGFPDSPSSALSFTYYLLFGHPFGKSGDMTNVGDIDVDWVLVRRYADMDPSTAVGGEKTP